MESWSHHVSILKFARFALADFSSYEMLVGSSPLFHGDICQWPYTLDHSIREEAQELVGALLVRSPDRLGPDEIVMHPFIASGSYLEKMSPAFRTYAPISPRHGPVHDASLLQRYCQLAGVGRGGNDEYWPCVGTKERVNGIRDRKEGIWSLGIKWAV